MSEIYKQGDLVTILTSENYKKGVVEKQLVASPMYYYVNPIVNNQVQYDMKLVLHINEIYKEA